MRERSADDDVRVDEAIFQVDFEPGNDSAVAVPIGCHGRVLSKINNTVLMSERIVPGASMASIAIERTAPPPHQVAVSQSPMLS